MSVGIDALEKAAAGLDPEQTVYMVNLLKFNEKAQYRQSESDDVTGREAYFHRYAPAFNEIAAGEDYGLSWVGRVNGIVVGDHGESWDDIVIVRYAKLGVLQRILSDPRYDADVDPHREAAVMNWKFFLTTVPPQP